MPIKDPFQCAHCRKFQTEQSTFTTFGRGGGFICDECVVHCYDVLGSKNANKTRARMRRAQREKVEG